MSKLDQLRGNIDEIDHQIVHLFERRMAVTRAVGEYKREIGMPVLDATREREVIAQKLKLLTNRELQADVVLLYEAIMGISRRQQRNLVSEGRENTYFRKIVTDIARAGKPIANPRVIYQGEPGAYSEMAVIRFFGDSIKSKGLEQFEDVFLALKNGEADYGVLPIENSSTGAIRQIYDLMTQHDCFVVGETTVAIQHCLMALPGATLDTIRTVYSHEQGLFQCERYLNEHPNWNCVPQADTAGSANIVAQSGDRSKAAICSKRSAELYGLEILAEAIHSNSNNTTRFVVVSQKMELREGRDKISTCFCLPHQSGSLHEILTIFAVHGLNMVRLESRPIQGSSWEYMFFLEFAGDVTAPGMEGVFLELTQLAEQVRVLGNFPSNLS